MSGPIGIVRPEADGLWANPVSFLLGGRPAMVRPLTMRESRAWKALLAEKLSATVASIVASAESWETTLNAFSGMTDEMLELLLAFDLDHTLGSKDDVEELATPAEITRAFTEVVQTAFPLPGDLWKRPEALAQVIRALAAMRPSAPSSDSFSNAPSSNGAKRRASSSGR